jgi:FAD/FMN-containing dehydrogenase
MRRVKADWRGLEERIAGQVLLPGSPAYEWSRRSFIARFDEIAPAVVARCSSAEDVAQVVLHARELGSEVAIRGGGHSLAGHSSTKGALIDLTPMDSVRVDRNVATVAAGVRTGELYERLVEHDLTLPAGTCPSVGIVGLALGGGFGPFGRKYGFTLDHLLAAQVVLADGRIVSCDERVEADLFWALRGAGAGNFGVVTSLTFELRPIRRMTNFHLSWRPKHAASVVEAWQSWVPTGPDELAADLALTAPEDTVVEPSVEVYGVFNGTEQEALGLLETLIARVGAKPNDRSCHELGYRETIRQQAANSSSNVKTEQTPSGLRSRQGYRVTKSELFDRPLPAQGIGALLENLCAERSPGQYRSVEFASWGGAYNRTSPLATAFAHRSQLFSLEHTASVDLHASPTARRAALEWARRSWAAVHSCGSGRVYPNFPDPDLSHWAEAYYAENLGRLVELKRTYDPERVFRFAQGLPTALGDRP